MKPLRNFILDPCVHMVIIGFFLFFVVPSIGAQTKPWIVVHSPRNCPLCHGDHKTSSACPVMVAERITGRISR